MHTNANHCKKLIPQNQQGSFAHTPTGFLDLWQSSLSNHLIVFRPRRFASSPKICSILYQSHVEEEDVKELKASNSTYENQ